ncbi:CHAT domain-containing protein, partial [Synechococcus sp. EJ6-Ellesmere]|uniref:CHAT domain-containing protein n=1 Tax=Synechococcus sp. EJ6-Ellesmere TaxID=2823734 RepID=UPI0020CE7970
LAELYRSQGAYAKAEPLYLRALAIRENALGPDHADTATSLNDLAVLYFSQGAYAKAEPLLLHALANNEKARGPNHPSTATSLNNLAFLYFNQGAYAKAEPIWRRATRNTSLFLQRELPLLPESRRRGQQQVLDDSSGAFYGVATRWAEGPSLALFSRFNRHGLLQQIQQRQALLSRGSGSQRQLADQIAGLTSRLAAVNLSSQQRQELLQQKDQLEQQLYRLLPALQPRVVDVDQVAKALPSDGVLVEFQRYQPFDGKQPPNQRWGSPRYLALILKPNGSIQAVELGEAKPIEEAIANALLATSQLLGDAPARLADVSRLVLDPLKPHLAGSRQWFLSPDGELNRVPFAALPSPLKPSQTLAEAVQLRLLTTGRDLLRYQQPSAKGQAPLVLANPAYDRRPGAGGSGAAVAVATNVESGQRRSSAADGLRWAALPATAAEGTRISAILGTTPVTGTEATVKRLQGTVSPRVLHIATHGFFAPDQSSKPDERLAGLAENSPMLAGFKGEDPMLRSGLVLAGANQPQANPSDDGYLTAAEAAGLQLEGTELVVLSACSTGQGDIRTGEGVYGLQRALTVAGARSTLLSLWKVDDRATAAFMETFYTRLKTGAGRAEALAATQAEYRSHPIPAWRHPYYWAAWQLVGDWSPMQGL